MDFVADSLSDGRRIRLFTVIDSFTRECLGLEVVNSLPSQLVTETLDRVTMHPGAPRAIPVDTGTEFTFNHFDTWAYFRGVDVGFIHPGKLVDNAHFESLIGHL